MIVKRLAIYICNAIVSLSFRRMGMKVLVGEHSTLIRWRISPQKNGVLSVGTNSVVSTKIFFERPNASVHIGSRTFIGGKGIFSVASNITVGDDVLIAWGCVITDHDSHSIKFSERSSDVVDYISGRKNWSNVSAARVHVGDKVWIGFNCSLLKGVTIGEGSVVAANSNVTRDVPPWTLAAGNPARVIRELTPE